MSQQLKQIQSSLASQADTNNVKFFEKMVPGRQKIYGVKTPALNALARQYKNGSFDLAEELWKSGALEEKIIAIKIMERTGKTDPERLLKLFIKFSKKIDNWTVCDGLGMQFLRGIVKSHESNIFELAEKLSDSPDPWQRRLSLVMVEWYTRDKKYHERIRRLVNHLGDDPEYYVKKAVTWIKRNFQKGK